MSYKKLDVWKLTRELVVEIHKMTLTELPKFNGFVKSRHSRGGGNPD